MEGSKSLSSPGKSPIHVRDCIEELLKFTLELSINVNPELDIGLSKEYCSNLLNSNDDDDFNSYTNDSFEGVPPYPLYKHLAFALYKAITCGTLDKTSEKMVLIHEGNILKEREDEWIKLVLEKGSELVNVLKTIDFELHVQEPFFSQLKDGLKTIEGRCAVGDYNRIGSGSMILFNKRLVLEVQDLRRYASFSEMLEAEGLAKVLPGVGTIEEGVQIYRKFYTAEKEMSNGVLAICVGKPAAQPYTYLAGILSVGVLRSPLLNCMGLSYEGIRRFMGLVHTVGTVSDAIPPPRSTLISSFMLRFNPNVQCSTLTDGARALTKHVNRSSNKYWGILDGSDSDKNKSAMDVINHLIAHCCWLNLHIVPPHGAVFEIRVAEGYGARWSKDGMKFIGFLEPYMEDGHSKKWKQ